MEEKLLYEKYKEGKHWEKHPTIYAQRFAKFLNKHEFKGLLVDAGCGNGRDVNVLNKNRFNVLGIDISAKEIKLAAQNYPDAKFEQQNIERLKFSDESVGAFFMINVIHYVKKEKALKEIYRTLRKKGLLLVHFNISIIDDEGVVDYEHKENDIFKLVSDFDIVEKRIFERVDSIPKKHTHKIMELIVQKK